MTTQQLTHENWCFEHDQLQQLPIVRCLNFKTRIPKDQDGPPHASSTSLNVGTDVRIHHLLAFLFCLFCAIILFRAATLFFSS